MCESCGMNHGMPGDKESFEAARKFLRDTVRQANPDINAHLVVIINKDGSKQYGLPNHTPMLDWNDYRILSDDELAAINRSESEQCSKA